MNLALPDAEPLDAYAHDWRGDVLEAEELRVKPQRLIEVSRGDADVVEVDGGHRGAKI